MARSLGGLQGRIYLLVVLAFLPAVGLYWHANRELRRSLVREQHANLTRTALVAQASFARLLDDSHTLLGALAQVPQIREGRGADCDAILSEVLKEATSYTTLSVIGLDGYLSCGSLTPQQGLYLGDRAYFVEASSLETFVVGEFAIGRITGKPTVGLALPLMDEAGQVTAVLASSLDLNALARGSEIDLPEGASLTVLDRDGTVMLRSPNLGEELGVEHPAGFPDMPLASGVQLIDGQDLSGFPSVFAVAPLRGEPGGRAGYVVASLPAGRLGGEGAERPAARQLRFLAVTGLILLVVAWVFGHYGIAREIKTT